MPKSGSDKWWERVEGKWWTLASPMQQQAMYAGTHGLTVPVLRSRVFDARLASIDERTRRRYAEMGRLPKLGPRLDRANRRQLLVEYLKFPEFDCFEDWARAMGLLDDEGEE